MACGARHGQRSKRCCLGAFGRTRAALRPHKTPKRRAVEDSEGRGPATIQNVTAQTTPAEGNGASRQETKSPLDGDGVMAVGVEFLAQFVFNFSSCSAVATAKAMGASDLGTTLEIMAFHFVLLFVLVGGTQRISGGHFNPMVSVMMAVWGELTLGLLPLYVIAQLTGGALGSAAQFFLLPASQQDFMHAAVQAVPPDHTVLQAFVGEMVAAFILMFTICIFALDPRGKPERIPFIVALTIPMLIFVLGPVSSMCINPARAFGPALVSGFWRDQWIFYTAPFLGGLAAVLPYKWMLKYRSGM